MNIDSFLEDMMDDQNRRNSASAALPLFEKILARVPSFKQALFTFEAKEGVFGPFAYWDSSLRQDAVSSDPDAYEEEENGGWYMKEGKFEFLVDCEDPEEEGYTEASGYEAGSAVAEILNNESDALTTVLFGGSRAPFSNGNSLTGGVLEVSVAPQPSSVMVGEDDSGSEQSLSKGFKGLWATFTSTVQVSNSVEVE